MQPLASQLQIRHDPAGDAQRPLIQARKSRKVRGLAPSSAASSGGVRRLIFVVCPPVDAACPHWAFSCHRATQQLCPRAWEYAVSRPHWALAGAPCLEWRPRRPGGEIGRRKGLRKLSTPLGNGGREWGQSRWNSTRVSRASSAWEPCLQYRAKPCGECLLFAGSLPGKCKT